MAPHASWPDIARPSDGLCPGHDGKRHDYQLLTPSVFSLARNIRYVQNTAIFPQAMKLAKSVILGCERRCRPFGEPAAAKETEKNKMIDHVSIGVRDIAKAKAFCDAALKPLGYAYLSPGESSLGYGGDAARFWLNLAESPVPPDTKSGLHFCFAAPSREKRRRLHIAQRSLQVGATTASLGLRGRLRAQPFRRLRGRSRRLPDRGLLQQRELSDNGLDLKRNRDEGEAPTTHGLAIADIGALYTRLVPGFVVDTSLQPGARRRDVRQRHGGARADCHDRRASRRLVWTAEGGRTTHSAMRRSKCFRTPTKNYCRRLDRRFFAGRHDGSNRRGGDGSRLDRDEKTLDRLER